MRCLQMPITPPPPRPEPAVAAEPKEKEPREQESRPGAEPDVNPAGGAQPQRPIDRNAARDPVTVAAANSGSSRGRSSCRNSLRDGKKHLNPLSNSIVTVASP